MREIHQLRGGKTVILPGNIQQKGKLFRRERVGGNTGIGGNTVTGIGVIAFVDLLNDRAVLPRHDGRVKEGPAIPGKAPPLGEVEKLLQAEVGHEIARILLLPFLCQVDEELGYIMNICHAWHLLFSGLNISLYQLSYAELQKNSIVYNAVLQFVKKKL